MKITRDQLDIARAIGARVLLDGIERTRVVAADEERRFVQMLRHNGRGLVLNAAGDDVEIDTLHGEVAIVPAEWADARLVAMLQPDYVPPRFAAGGPVPAGTLYLV